jgi:hypothetical protein
VPCQYLEQAALSPSPDQCFPSRTATNETRRKEVFVTDNYIFEAAAEPKELHVVPDAGHVDLYDKTDLIPFDKLDEFFIENLATPSSDAVGELVGSKS